MEAKLNNELLKEEPEEKKEVKRNSKEYLKQNILKIVEKYDLDFEYSDTRLKRMNKEQLTKLLAECVEKGVQQDIAKSVGVDPRAKGKVVTLGALRMVHNIAATGFEKCFNRFLTPYTGLESEGFAEGLKHPSIQGTVDECLAEIAAENPEVLEYFDSPYTRLALVWVGVISSTLKKAHGFSRVGPKPDQRTAARRPGRSGKPEERQVDSHHEPRVQTI